MQHLSASTTCESGIIYCEDLGRVLWNITSRIPYTLIGPFALCRKFFCLTKCSCRLIKDNKFLSCCPLPSFIGTSDLHLLSAYMDRSTTSQHMLACLWYTVPNVCCAALDGLQCSPSCSPRLPSLPCGLCCSAPSTVQLLTICSSWLHLCCQWYCLPEASDLLSTWFQAEHDPVE